MARPGLMGKIKDAGDWMADKARGFWSWAKKHPILASALIAGIVAAAFFPFLYVVLPIVPYVGPAILVLASQAPLWTTPIVWGLTVAAVAVQTAVTLLVIEGLKKFFATKMGTSLLRAVQNPFGSTASLDSDTDEVREDLVSSANHASTSLDKKPSDFVLNPLQAEGFSVEQPLDKPFTRTPPPSPVTVGQQEQHPSEEKPLDFEAAGNFTKSRHSFHRNSPAAKSSLSSLDSRNSSDPVVGSGPK